MSAEEFYINGQCVDPSEFYSDPDFPPAENFPPLKKGGEGGFSPARDTYETVTSNNSKLYAGGGVGVAGVAIIAGVVLAPEVVIPALIIAAKVTGGVGLLATMGCISSGSDGPERTGATPTDDAEGHDLSRDNPPCKKECSEKPVTPDAMADADRVEPDGSAKQPPDDGMGFNPDAGTGDADAEVEDPDAGTGDDDASVGDDDAEVEDPDAGTGDDDASTECSPDCPAVDGGDDDADAGTGDDDAAVGDDDAGTGDDDAGTGDDDAGPDVIDFDGDGYAADVDCDDNDAAVYENLTLATDADGDGATVGVPQTICAGPELPADMAFESVEPDCDDTDPDINPLATETPYDTIDQDCTGADLTDVDNDGIPAIVAGGTDCDDSDIAVYQWLAGAADTDNDGRTLGPEILFCSGPLLDEPGFSPPSAEPDCDETFTDRYQYLTGFADGDNDGVTVAVAESVCSGVEIAAGFSEIASFPADCNDTDPTTRPGIAQTFSGHDNNCDGSTELTSLDGVTFIAPDYVPENGFYGMRVAMGNINGDIYGDVIISFPYQDTVYPDGSLWGNEGQMNIIYGGPDKFVPGAVFYLPEDADFTYTGACEFELGEHIVAHDWDGDGKSEIFFDMAYASGVCDPGYGGGDGTGLGNLAILHGTAATRTSVNFLDVPALSAEFLAGQQMSILHGWAAYGMPDQYHISGDIDGDGLKQFIFRTGGVFKIVSAEPFEGERYLDDMPAYEITDYFFSLMDQVADGDINNDGLHDLIIGDSSGELVGDTGMATILLGSENLPSNIYLPEMVPGSEPGSVNFLRLAGNEPGDHYGATVAVGDGDGDGIPDLVEIAAPGALGGAGCNVSISTARIRAALADGSVNYGDTLWVDDQVRLLGANIVSGASVTDQLPTVTKNVDLNGDGVGDLLLASATRAGLFVYDGANFSSSFGQELSTSAANNRVFGVSGSWFGAQVAAEADVDADGCHDVLIAAPNSNEFQLFFGGPRSE